VVEEPGPGRTGEGGPVEGHAGEGEGEAAGVVEPAAEEDGEVVEAGVGPGGIGGEGEAPLGAAGDGAPPEDVEGVAQEVAAAADDLVGAVEGVLGEAEAGEVAGGEVEREPVAADRVGEAAVAAVEAGEGEGEPQLAGGVLVRSEVAGGVEPARGEARERPQVALAGEARAAEQDLLGLGEAEQERLPVEGGGLAAAGEHGLLAGPGGAADAGGSVADAAGGPQGVDPAGDAVEEVLVRARLDAPAAERDGEVGLAVALDVAEALEGVDAPGDAEAGDRPRELEGALGGAGAELAAALGEQLGDLGVGGRGGPQGHPLLAAGALVGVAGAAVADGRAAQREGGGGLRELLRFGAADERGAEDDRALEHEDEVPRVDEALGAEAGALVRTAGAAGQELPDRRAAAERRGRVAPQRRGEQRDGVRLRRCVGRLHGEEPGEAAHEVIGEVEAAVVAAGAEERGV
jgi:hypothetical protein